VRRRLITSYLALTLVVLVVLEVPLALTYRSRERQQLATAAERDAYQVGNYAEDTLEGDARADLAGYVRSFARSTHDRVEVYDRAGRLVAAAGASPPAPVLVTDIPVVTSGKTVGRVRLVYGADRVDDRIHSYWLLLALVGLGCLAAAALVGVFLSRWVTQPLGPMRAAARRLGHGDLSARVGPAGGPPELQEMAETFDDMAARLEELVGAQEAFVADASHQLRTPLTALRLRLENLEAEVAETASDAPASSASASAAELADDLAGARQETQRLSRLVDGLLTLARADRGEDGEARRRLAVDEVTAERVEAWRPIAEEYQLELVSEPSGLAITASPDRLAQVLDNLLANATEASPAHGRIRLWADHRPEGAWVEVHVTDQGPGLTPEQRARAFDRFWRAPGATRADSARGASGVNGETLGGSGLGLAIVARLVAADGGAAELRPTPGHGVDAVVRYPVPER